MNNRSNKFQINNQDTYDQVNHLFEEQNEEQKKVQDAREILGDDVEGLNDNQIIDLVNEIQYLVDSWIEEYEQKVFDGKTLKELLQLNL